MKTFTLKANIKFSADNLDEARGMLMKLFEDPEGHAAEFEGDMTIESLPDPIAEVSNDIGPEFAAELSNYYHQLASKQQALGDPFATVLQENLWDLYDTTE